MATADGVETLDRDQIEKFLTTCMDNLTSEATRTIMKNPTSGRPHARIIEMQKHVWEELGVSVEAGRLAVSKIKDTFPDDHADLLALRDKFAKTIDATYLQCLEDRRPSTLKKKGKMPRNAVLDFLEACNVKLDMPEVRDLLRQHIKETGTMPDPLVNELHNEVMELVGFEREYGQKCFLEFGNSKEFMQDREVATGFARWRGKTSNVCILLLNEYRRDGGELNVDEDVQNKCMDFEAKEQLTSMSPAERSALIEKNVSKVNIFHKLPPEGQQRYLERLSPEDKMELAKSQMLLATLVQSQQANKE